MATSGSVDFTINRDQIIEAAAQQARILGLDQTLSYEQVTVFSRQLNMMVKQWQGTADFAPGLKEWSRKTGYVFLQSGQSSYSIGPSGDRAATSYATTTTSAAASSGASTIVVTSATSIAASDYIGVELASGALQWTTVNGAPAGSTVTLTVTLTGNVSSGARVFTYSTQIRRPISILTAVLRDTSNIDSPMYPMLLTQYERIADKTADGAPARYYYQADLTNGTMKLDVEPDDVTKVIRIVYLSNIEDFDAATDTPDYPQEWLMPLVDHLAIRIAPIGGVPVTQEMRDNANVSLAVAKNLNPETTDAYFEPGRE